MRLALILLSVIYPLNTLLAFDYKEMIRKDPAMVSGEFYHYIYTAAKETAAPKGYKPFYISHYGRHGSRYHTGTLYFSKAMTPLQKADSLGLLTAEGKSLLADLQELLDIHQGHFGMLSERGLREHRGIAERMYQRFPEVFSGKGGRTQILCRSSLAPRCLSSMANFMSSLQQHSAGNIVAKMYCSDSIQKIIAPERDLKKIFSEEKIMEDSIRQAECPPEKFLKRLFTDVSQTKSFLEDPVYFMKYIVDCGAIVNNLENGPDIFKHFTQEELQGLWIARNARFYYLLADSKECPECPHLFVDSLMKDIVIHADKAVKRSSAKVADFRFGHDTMVLPLASLLGLDGMNGRHSATHVQNLWNCTRRICMASNIQFVFYRNKENDILVKCMYNEQEHLIPALQSHHGCFYKWQELKKHITALYQRH